jgi:hypothetical protein
MKSQARRITCLFVSGVLVLPLAIADDTDYTGSPAWQERRLFEPTPSELREEAQGRVFIYDGVTDPVVDRAMDEQFARIESMMFIHIQKQKTRPDGDVVSYVDDDGC